MVAVELVADRATKAPFPRALRVTERTVAAARDRGLLLYSSTGCADGVNGDLVMLGPPLVATDAEIDEMVELTTTAVEAVASESGGA
jgi:adenosylmethionine-8-amino-7-oxononanoate aminotransferase